MTSPIHIAFSVAAKQLRPCKKYLRNSFLTTLQCDLISLTLLFWAILVLLVGLVGTPALATGIDISYEKRVNLIQSNDWVMGSGDTYWWGNEVAYCLSEGKESPSSTVWPGSPVDSHVAAILEAGYPNTRTFNGVELDDVQARQATQVAIWVANDGGNNARTWTYGDLYPSRTNAHLGSAEALAASQWLYESTLGISPSRSYTRYFVGGDEHANFQWMVVSLLKAPTGSLMIEKKSLSDEILKSSDAYSLAGATYEVRDTQGTLVGSLTTDETGNTSVLDELTPGTYIVKETLASKGFELDLTEHHIEVIADQTATVTSIERPLLAGDTDHAAFRIIKTPASEDASVPGLSLAGAVFTVTHQESGWTWQATTNDDGVATLDAVSLDSINGVPLGTIVVEEVSPPLGFLPLSQPQTFTVDHTGTVKNHMVELKPNVKNYVARGDIKIEKARATRDADPVPLQGVEFEVVRTQDNSVLYTLITDEAGKASTEGLGPEGRGALPYGTYALREVKAPDGIVRQAEPTKFSVDERGLIQGDAVHLFALVNDVTKVEISKQDMVSGEELPGAHLTILDQAGNEIESWISSNEPHYIEMLKPGDYTLRETQAPDGYILTEEITFTVNDTGEIHRVIMTNAPKKPGIRSARLPKSGDYVPKLAVQGLALASACFITSGALVLAMRKRRKD